MLNKHRSYVEQKDRKDIPRLYHREECLNCQTRPDDSLLNKIPSDKKKLVMLLPYRRRRFGSGQALPPRQPMWSNVTSINTGYAKYRP